MSDSADVKMLKLSDSWEILYLMVAENKRFDIDLK